MKTLILKTILLFVILTSAGMTRSQTIVTTAGTIYSCPGQVLVPVTVVNGQNIGSISLVLDYDNNFLTYSGYQDVNAALDSGMMVVNGTGTSVYISWFFTEPAFIGDDTLMMLIFNGFPGANILSWNTGSAGNCEYTDGDGQIMPAEFINGFIEVYSPVQINSQPQNQLVPVGTNAGFSVAASGSGTGYHWQVSTDNGITWDDLVNDGTFSGVYGPDMVIASAPLNLNGYRFRCSLWGFCTENLESEPALLTVYDPQTTIIYTNLPVAGTCTGSLDIPITVSNFTHVEAFSLVFSYNPAILTFTGFGLPNPALSVGEFMANESNGRVYLTWYSTSPVTMGNDTIIHVQFTGIPGYGDLIWDTQTPGNCEYTLSVSTPVAPVFTNGWCTVYASPAITGNPASSTVPKGLNTSFSASAGGSWINYQWQISTDGGSSWSDLPNDAHHGNVTSDVLYISNAQPEMSGNRYRCRVAGYCLPDAFTLSAELTVVQNVLTTCHTAYGCPGVLTVPVTVSDFYDIGAFSMTLIYDPSVLTYNGTGMINENLSAGSFLANAAGGKIFLNWFSETAVGLNDNDTLFSLVFTGASGSSSLTWDLPATGACEYSDSLGKTVFGTWYDGYIQIDFPPAIVSNPAGTTVLPESPATFTMAASGAGLTYQWQLSENGGLTWQDLQELSPYSGVIGTTLYISRTEPQMDGFLYRCRVTGTCIPAIQSSSALLTVLPYPVTTTMGGITGSCTGNLTLPVMVTHCDNIGGISLILNYDPEKLVFDGYQNLNSQLNSGTLVLHNTGSQIVFSWYSLTPLLIGTGTLVEYRFKATDGISTSLDWDLQTPGNCEYSNSDGQIVNSFFNNGLVTISSNALMVNAGEDVRVKSGDSAALHGMATGGASPYMYRWTPSTGISDTVSAEPMASPPVNFIYQFAVTDQNGCTGKDLVMVYVPVIATDTVVSVTAYSALSGGTVLSDGGATPLSRGVCWAMQTEPDIHDDHTSDGSGMGHFTSAITGLTPCTQYWVRAYFINQFDTTYGPSCTFTTLPIPVTVNISASANPVCTGLPVTITALPQNGGNAPVYTWYLNDNEVSGVTGASYTFTPAAGSAVYCKALSNSVCVTANPATSNTIVFTLYSLPVPVVNGPTLICPNTSGHLYETYAGMTNYTWNVSSGGFVTSGGGISDHTVIVTWLTSGIQSVSVNFTNATGCRAAVPTSLTVDVGFPPGPAGTITGTSSVTQGQSGVSYSVSPIAGASNYVWTVPPGAEIVSGQGTPSISVNYTASSTSGNINVYGANSCSNGLVSPNFYVTVYAAVPPTYIISNQNITSGQSVCYNATQSLYVAGAGSTFKVFAGGSAILISGRQIIFNPGASVAAGGYLHGYISPVGQYCNNIAKVATVGSENSDEENLVIASSGRLRIWPNPTEGDFTVLISNELKDQWIVEIYNLCGKRILKDDNPGLTNRHYSLSGQPKGIYFMKIKTEGRTEMFKIIRQ